MGGFFSDSRNVQAFSSYVPPPPPPPPPAASASSAAGDADDAGARARLERLEEVQRRRSGRASTIVTSPRGILTRRDVAGGRKTLFGE